MQGRLISRESMATVIAIEHEQLFALAQAGKADDLRLGHAGVLSQDVACCGRDDPASARPRQHTQTASPPGHRVSAAHVRLGVSSDDDDCAAPQPGPGGGSGEMLRMVPKRRKHQRVLRPSSCPWELAPWLASELAPTQTASLRPLGRRHIDREEVVHDRLAWWQPYACVASVVLRTVRLAGQGRRDYGGAREIVALELTE
jgi:hypothetical protein